jgi:pyoverdine/dityrosine biosynthesis protein Dit1
METSLKHDDKLAVSNLVEGILDEIFSHRRKFEEDQHCLSQKCVSCRAVHRTMIEYLIRKNLPISFILPAFPAKSMNRNKTAGPLPDMGEVLSLRFLNTLCDRIGSLYTPGARLTICSDGRVFNDLVKVKDAYVALYAEAIKDIIERDKLTNLDLFNLEDFFGDIPFHMMRDNLTQHYAEPLAELKERTKNTIEDKLLFNGIHRFIFEDQSNMFDGCTKNKIKNITKDIAYQVIQRSNAWSKVIKQKFPSSIRLSIHPQPCQSEKIGIMLLKSNSTWVTPWHSVPVFNGSDYYLMKKSHAEKINAVPIMNNQGVFTHYEVSANEF